MILAALLVSERASCPGKQGLLWYRCTLWGWIILHLAEVILGLTRDLSIALLRVMHKINFNWYNFVFSYLFLKRERSQHLVGLDEHVDYPRGTVAPVDQQVASVAHTGGEIARRELQLADIVYAGLHQAVQLCVAHLKAGLKMRKGVIGSAGANGSSWAAGMSFKP